MIGPEDRRAIRTLAVAFGALGASYAALRHEGLMELDRRASASLAVPRGQRADVVVAAATDLGSVFALTGASGVLLATGRRRAALDVFAGGSAAWAAAQVLKPLVDRPRPYQAEDRHRLVAEPAGSSWPSGHPAVAAAMAAAVAPSLPPAARSGGAGLAGFVAVSRVYVGVHYLSDVVAGLALGTLCGRAWRWFRRRVERALI